MTYREKLEVLLKTRQELSLSYPSILGSNSWYLGRELEFASLYLDQGEGSLILRLLENHLEELLKTTLNVDGKWTPTYLDEKKLKLLNEEQREQLEFNLVDQFRSKDGECSIVPQSVLLYSYWYVNEVNKDLKEAIFCQFKRYRVTTTIQTPL